MPGSVGRSIARSLAVATVLAMTAVLAVPVEAAVDRGGGGTVTETGRYVVIVHDGVDPAEVARDRGMRPDHLYRYALRGFVAGMSPRDARRLQGDERVRSVEGEAIERVQTLALPTGIDRIDADRNPEITTDGSGITVDADIAVIDTGIDADHPDLVVAGGRNFANGGVNNWGDRNGHGTHVAGTIAAVDDGQGVVGVAPGARLWALRVCGNSGFCMGGDIVAGIDWMAGEKRAGRTDFAAANFSISSADSSNDCGTPANATHRAICGAVDAGIVFVMAAGNDGREKTPYPVALSVSAVADFDGEPGGVGSPTCRNDEDDTLANFSNHGPNVRIAAPGVCILSTWPGGGYNTISGTSMAAPHVTGAVALYLHANAEAPAESAAEVLALESAIIEAAHPQGTSEMNPCSYDDTRSGGPLLFVNAGAFGGDGRCGPTDETEPPADPPLSVSMTSPADGAELSGDITLTAETTGDPESVEFRLAPASNGDEEGETRDATHEDDGVWSVVWDTRTVADGEYELTAIAKRAEDEVSHTITVSVVNGSGDPPEPDDPAARTVSVSNVALSTSGRWHLRVAVTVSDEDGRAVGGANVALTIQSSAGEASATVTTGSDGTGTVQFNHALRDAPCWTATIDSVTGDGLEWDGDSPQDVSNCG